MNEHEYFEIIEKKLDVIQSDIEKLFDKYSNTNDRVIKLEIQLGILWKITTTIGISALGLVIKTVMDLVIK